MKTQWKRFLLTLGFMTRIPVTVDLGEVKDEDMHKGFLYYPVVGLIIGLVDVTVYLLAVQIFPEMIGILFALLANFFVTGAFHLDGLCDTADGIYSARTKERMLEIMKDSRIGTNGGIAMCFDILMKFAGLMSCENTWVMILMMPVAGKMIQGAVVYKAVYPREKGIGIYVGTVSLGTVIGTMILGVCAMTVAFSFWGIVMFAVLFFLAWMFRRYITGKIGGITGDVMGAASELSEIMLLLLVLMITKFAGFPMGWYPVI
ncbi:MAG: adenosylcobinamide-GDP ribazoletransferase [Eubacteriales bacterium]|nr:adenosylcobinamide-GDP ribazoletransferase [Eubacteriales bacterium]